MVTARRFLRAAGACLMLCPLHIHLHLVMGIGEGEGDCTGWMRQNHRNRRGAAWIGPSFLSQVSPQRCPWWGAASHPRRATSKSWRPPSGQTVAPMRSSPSASLTSSRSSRDCRGRPCAKPSTNIPTIPPPLSTVAPFSKPDSRHLWLPAATAASSEALAGFSGASTMLPPSVPWLAGRRVAVFGRGRCGGGSRLGAVAAVSSPGDGAAAAAAYVEEAEEFREAFDAAAGEDGLLGFDQFRTIPDVRQLLDEGLLGDSELVEIWKAVPKANEGVDRVDFDGFAQAFARVDALFEEEEEEKRGVVHAGGDGDDLGVGSIGGGVRAPSQADADATRSFIELAGSSGGLLDLAGLLRWSEINQLVKEGLLAPGEAEAIWDGLPKVANSISAAGGPKTDKGTLIDLQGFLEFDRKLSDLFEDDSGEGEAEAESSPATRVSAPPSGVAPDTSGDQSRPPASMTSSSLGDSAATGGAKAEAEMDTESGTLLKDQFAALANESAGGLVLTLEDLLGWSQVSELLEDGLLTLEEVDEMFQALPKAGDGASIDLNGFAEFTTKLESMFEDVPDEDEDQDGVFQRASGPPLATPSPRQASVQAPAASAGGSAAGVGLDSGLSALPISTSPPPEVEAAEGKKLAESKERLVALAKAEMKDCGMGCGEEKRAELMEATEALVAVEEGNLVLAEDLGSDLIVPALVGEWRLLYTSSNAMEYNQGLTGLANTIPSAKFYGLRQILHADGMVFDAEYEEELSIRDESEPLVITVTSDWEVKQTSSLITGKSTVAVSVAPKEIKYGFITVRSGRWKTLRAMTLLDIAYLDSDLRIMRGQTARQNIFVFERISAA